MVVMVKFVFNNITYFLRMAKTVVEGNTGKYMYCV